MKASKASVRTLGLGMLALTLALAACTGGPFGSPADEDPSTEQAAQGEQTATTATAVVPTVIVPTVAVPTAAAPQVNPGNFVASNDVIADGAVEAAQDVDLVFQVNGTVGRVYVEEGDEVDAGQILAVLDTRSFDQAIRDAEAALISARADQSALSEPPTDEARRVAQTSVDQAVANLTQVQGSVTQADINAAYASLEEARAALADLEAGADTLDVQAAQIQVDQARVNLQNQRDNLSHAKTQAEISLQQASEQVRSAQADYSAAYWDWRYVQDYDQAPPQTDNPRAGGPPLSDHSEQAYRDRLTQAEIALANAETNLQAADKQLEQARQNEITGVQTAEEQLRTAENNLAQVLEPAEADQLAAARARVASADANLQRLLGQQRQGQLAAAQAGVANAQANLERLDEPPTESQLVRAEAGIARAEANLAQAELNREYAEIRAPFAGEIAVINIDPGDVAPTGAGAPAIRLVDLSTLFVEITVSDADIAQVEEGQQVTVIADALPSERFMGEVIFVSPTSTVINGVTNYLVRVELVDQNAPLRVGMTVSATIDVD